MWIPMVILAGLCVVFGVFAKSVPLNNYILPAVPGVSFLGLWEPGLATLLIIVGVAVGALIFLAGKVKPARESEAYVGGEALQPEMRVSGVEFYYTVRDFGLLGGIYRSAERKLFDIYDLGRNGTLAFTRALAKIHTGVLTNYFSWVLLGLIVLLVVILAV
jgi:NADH:ubiquinone oxidoreductase subunit 5 (subunit L)/multisubunit Na+/H+ antiporter MnhA subunit